MGPKKSKKGKKGKKSKSGRSKQKITLTPKEEILNYQIQIKEDCFNNLNFELEKLKEENDKLFKKLDVFYLDKEHFTNEMIKNYHESVSNITEKPVYKKSDVIMSMKSNWDFEKIEKQEILEIQRSMEVKDKKIKELEQNLIFLQNIRNNEIDNNNQQIIVLKQILSDMDNTFLTIKSYIEKTYLEKRNELLEKEQLYTERIQNDACIKASKIIKDDVKQEIADNKWLRSKRDIHRLSFEKLKSEIEKIESENVYLNEKIFRLRQSEEKFTNLFVSEIEPEEILFKDGILEYNFSHVFKKSESQSMGTIHSDSNKTYSKITSKCSEENHDLSFSSWKDYLNLNPVNFDFLYITGNLLNIREAGPKSEEEIQEEKFTLKTFPANLQSLNKIHLSDEF